MSFFVVWCALTYFRYIYGTEAHNKSLGSWLDIVGLWTVLVGTQQILICWRQQVMMGLYAYGAWIVQTWSTMAMELLVMVWTTAMVEREVSERMGEQEHYKVSFLDQFLWCNILFTSSSLTFETNKNVQFAFSSAINLELLHLYSLFGWFPAVITVYVFINVVFLLFWSRGSIGNHLFTYLLPR